MKTPPIATVAMSLIVMAAILQNQEKATTPVAMLVFIVGIIACVGVDIVAAINRLNK